VTRVFSARRFVTALACMTVVGVSAAACSTSATSAAQVGDVSIAESTIFERSAAISDKVEAAGGAAPSPATVADLNRSQTTSAIRGELLKLAADDLGVSVTDEQVNATLAQGGLTDTANQLGVPDSGLGQMVRDVLRLKGLVSNAPAAGAPVTNVVVSVDGVSVADRDAAVAARSQFLADPKSVDALIAASASPIQQQSLTVLQQPTDAPTGVFNAEQGEVILYPNPDGYYVLRILRRSVQPGVLTVDDLSAQKIGGQFDLGALCRRPGTGRAWRAWTWPRTPPAPRASCSRKACGTGPRAMPG